MWQSIRLTLRKDITCARDVDLAHRMAESLGIELWDDRQMPLGLEGEE